MYWTANLYRLTVPLYSSYSATQMMSMFTSASGGTLLQSFQFVMPVSSGISSYFSTTNTNTALISSSTATNSYTEPITACGFNWGRMPLLLNYWYSDTHSTVPFCPAILLEPDTASSLYRLEFIPSTASYAHPPYCLLFQTRTTSDGTYYRGNSYIVSQTADGATMTSSLGSTSAFTHGTSWSPTLYYTAPLIDNGAFYTATFRFGASDSQVAYVSNLTVAPDSVKKLFFGDDDLFNTVGDLDIVKSVGTVIYQLYSTEKAEDASRFSDMHYVGQIKAPRVTIDERKVDGYWWHQGDFYNIFKRNTSTRYWGVASSNNSDVWSNDITEYQKKFVGACIGGTWSSYGNSPQMPRSFISGISAIPVEFDEKIAQIPTPYSITSPPEVWNSAIVSPSAPGVYMKLIARANQRLPLETGSDVSYPPAYFRSDGYLYDANTDNAIYDLDGNRLFGIAATGQINAIGNASPLSRTEVINGFAVLQTSDGNGILTSLYGSAGGASTTWIGPYVGRNIYVTPAEFNYVRPLTEYERAFYQNETPGGGGGGEGETEDPNDYNPDGTTKPSTGPGSFDPESNTIPYPGAPSISVVDAGLITIFAPSVNDLRSLSNYMWSDLSTAGGWFDTAKKIFADPMQYFIALNILPFTIPRAGNSTEIKLAGISTGVSMHKATQQFVQTDCGSYTLKEFWGSALDYSPTTRIFCFLPYIGVVPIDPDLVMNTTLTIRYRTDILTGAFVTNILADDNVVYHYNGNMATNVPLTGADYSRFVSSLLSVAGSVALTAIGGAAGGMAATAGLGAAKAGVNAAAAGARATNALMASQAPTIGASMMHGANAPLASSMLYQLSAHTDQLANAGLEAAKAGANSQLKHTSDALLSAGRVALGFNTVNSIMASKPAIAISGQMSSCSGLMDVQYPYLIIQRPNQALPENYKHYVGYPSHMLADVQSCSGYTVFEQIELSGIPCNDDELSEIYEILKGGFYGSA